MCTIEVIRYYKKSGEFVINEKDAITGKRSKTYANNLTEKEREWAKTTKYYFEDEGCACWMN